MRIFFTWTCLVLLVSISRSHATAQNTLPTVAKQCAVSPQAAYQQIMASTPQTVASNQKIAKSHKPHASSQKSKTASSALININTATVAELTQLPSIGVKKAQAIVAYRQTQGNFSSVAELTNIKGIGKKTLAKFEHRLTLD